MKKAPALPYSEVMEFGELPPAEQTRTNYDRAVFMLQNHPGRWARILTASGITRSDAYRRRDRFIDRGAEAEVRPSVVTKHKYDVWARWAE